MIIRNSLALVWVAVGLCATARGAEAFQDFRHKTFDNMAFRLVGRNAERLITPTDKGLLIRLPSHDGNNEAVGVALRAVVRGNFEITASFEVVKVDKPQSDGVGAGMLLEFDSPQKDAITLERFLMPDGTETFTSTKITEVNGEKNYEPRRVPAQAKSGKFRMVRTDQTVEVYYADGDGEYQLLRSEQLGTGDVGLVRVAADSLYTEYGVVLLLRDFGIRADELVDRSSIKRTSTAWLPIAFVVLVLVPLIIFGAWTVMSRRSTPISSSKKPPPPRM
jgi:hypothetical protein